MLQFRLSKEIDGDRQVIEVWQDDLFVASIYTHEKSINIISKYIKNATRSKRFPDSVIIEFHL